MVKVFTFFGLLLGLVVMAISVDAISENMLIFYSLPSLGIIIGGLVFSIFISYSSRGVLFLFQTVLDVIRRDVVLPRFIALRFTEYSKIVAKGGFVALEKEISTLDENLIERKALDMLIAGYKKEDIKYIIENNTIERIDRLKDNVKLLKNLASYAPAFGMMGTVLGLISMLHSMGDDIGSIGPSMSVALITTLYGVSFSMLVFTPLAEKTRRQLELLTVNYRIILDGIIYLHEKRNYVFMRDALNAHLLPKYKLQSNDK